MGKNKKDNPTGKTYLWTEKAETLFGSSKKAGDTAMFMGEPLQFGHVISSWLQKGYIIEVESR